MSRISNDPLDLHALLDATASPSSGALVVFGGTVRLENDGRQVTGIHYTAHAPLAEKTLAEVETETLGRFAIESCRILHRIGELALGELSVLVVVRAAHRADAFAAARYAIDKLKQRVPIWKEERYTSGDSEYLEGVSLLPHEGHHKQT
jgi:molybdopterin synthase catalytic subunit